MTVEFLGVGQASNGVQVVPDHGRSHHRPGQGATASLIHASHEAGRVPGAGRPAQAAGARIFWIASAASWEVLRSELSCSAVKRCSRAAILGDLGALHPASPRWLRRGPGASRRPGSSSGTTNSRHKMLGRPTQGLQLRRRARPPAQGVHVVTDDHGPLEERGLQRRGAAGDQGGIARCEHRVRLACGDLQGITQTTNARPPARCGHAVQATAGTINLIAGRTLSTSASHLKEGPRCTGSRKAAAGWQNFVLIPQAQLRARVVRSGTMGITSAGGPRRWRLCRAARAALARTGRCRTRTSRSAAADLTPTRSARQLTGLPYGHDARSIVGLRPRVNQAHPRR